MTVMSTHDDTEKLQTLREQYGTGAELMYRYRIEIESGEAQRRAVDEMLKDMKVRGRK